MKIPLSSGVKEEDEAILLQNEFQNVIVPSISSKEIKELIEGYSGDYQKEIINKIIDGINVSIYTFKWYALFPRHIPSGGTAAVSQIEQIAFFKKSESSYLAFYSPIVEKIEDLIKYNQILSTFKFIK